MQMSKMEELRQHLEMLNSGLMHNHHPQQLAIPAAPVSAPVSSVTTVDAPVAILHATDPASSSPPASSVSGEPVRGSKAVPQSQPSPPSQTSPLAATSNSEDLARSRPRAAERGRETAAADGQGEPRQAREEAKARPPSSGTSRGKAGGAAPSRGHAVAVTSRSGDFSGFDT